MQEVHAHPQQGLEVVDLSAMRDPIAAEAEAKRLVEQNVSNESMHLLFAAKLLKLERNDHVLILRMHHIISDRASVGLLVRDIWTLYVQSVKGMPSALPDMPIQFPDYAAWQRETHHTWTRVHGDYWSHRLRGASPVRFPADEGAAGSQRERVNFTPIQFDVSLTTQLRELCRRERTILAVSVLTACSASILRWQEKDDLVLRFVTSGRNRVELENMIGFLASLLHLRIQLNTDDTFMDLFKRIAQEYNAAYEHDDASCMSVADPKPVFSLGFLVNWMPAMAAACSSEYPNLSTILHGSSDAIGLKPFENAPPSLKMNDGAALPDGDPILMLYETPMGISGFFHYQTDVLRASTMERLARNVKRFAYMLAQAPSRRVMDVPYEP
jgi:hypothetical protein